MKTEGGKPDTRWTLLYQDAVAQVWGVKSVFDEPSSDRYLDPAKRFITDVKRPLAVQWPAMPLKPATDVAQADTEKLSEQEAN